ncbi:hypothetical protein DAPPUDRAFT_262745 [Daphnia pulex]|uniref:VWF/SSPO/Zonadhesin-like cysteine-rich domain-containing protein n=1 Tax=Daphnia pulex TaxID=6669 RepID=E9HNL4_DAPPU|nr:hypothetical protein DAPPUDRAFT_262745 [Daphnia pulex]|eukprot:EFX66692.1 hypothetical protein DAPPUDRAFT_262745 [Daphnia pulex]
MALPLFTKMGNLSSNHSQKENDWNASQLMTPALLHYLVDIDIDIDPSPYLKMCLIKTRPKGNAQDGCHAAAAYASACAAKGVLLRIPSQCVRCQLDNELLSEGDVKNINADKLNRPSSEVVVLLDLKKCNEPDAT